MNMASLYRLMTWLSPAYPVGSFSYSHGIETAVAHGVVDDRATLENWISGHVRVGAGMSDAILFRHAYVAFASGDDSEVDTLMETARALAATAEIKLQTEQQGRAFVEATADAWSCEPIARLESKAESIPFPVAVSAACAGHDIDPDAGVSAYLTELVANLVSAGMRLIPLGQRDGQRAIANLEPVIADAVRQSATASLDDIGSAAPAIDLASMRHENQYTRLFRS